MLVDRGPVEPGTEACKFAEKVWNAQAAGAKGVVVANYDDALTTMEAPDDDDEISYQYLQNITIPATLVAKTTADALKGFLRNVNSVYISLDWTDALPKKQMVNWEFWTNSNDLCGPICDIQRDFIRDFVPVAKEFDGNGWTTFTPHYLVWVCPNEYRDSPECMSQCIRRGRYCSPDPDGSLQEGYSGGEVVEENLRQLCVFKLAQERLKPYIWWDYSTKFSEQCTMAKKDYGQECAEKVFAEILSGEGAWSTVEDLRACIGSQDEDAVHAVMEEQLVAQRGDGGEGSVFILPTIKVNGVQYRGKMAMSDVLRAICAGFVEGNRPAACAKITDDVCMQGGRGYADCAARTDGKTLCINTFNGYNCTCGQGFISHTEPDGSEKCLDINECLSISQLDPNCTCPRCGCKNTFGGYECIPNLPDECAQDYGGCWHKSIKVKGKQIEFSGCQDTIEAYKDALARGATMDNVTLHTCTCPPCFTLVEKSGGQLTCEPKCSLDKCELDLGICHQSAGLSAGGIAAIVIACSAVVVALGFATYKWHVKGVMQAEVRAIMAQYMPLEDAASSPKHVGEGGGVRMTRFV